MAISCYRRLILAVVVATLLAGCLWWLADTSRGVVLADAAGIWFVKPTGSGTTCTQAAPCTLQTATAQAQAGDVVHLAAGTYYGLDAGAVISVTRGFTLYGGWDGAPTGAVTRDPVMHVSVVDGQNLRQGIHISGTFTAGVDGLTVTAGKAEHGGGIYVTQAGVVLQGNVITACATITDAGFEWGRGGGICLISAQPCTVANNRITHNTSGYGGGIYQAYGTGGMIADNEISANVARLRGGGILIESVEAIVRGNRIANNSAEEDGGGILLWNTTSTVDGNRFLHNSASAGAGLSLGNGASASLRNNWVIQSSGDGMYVSGSSPQILNNTILGSGTPATGRGIDLYARPGKSPPYAMIDRILNNIVSGFTTGIVGRGPVTPTLDYNDVWDTTSSYSLPAHVSSGAHSISLDPRFVSAPSGDYHLRPDSPCINAGDPAGVPPAPPTDIDGDPRPLAGRVDIGADESAGFWYLWLPLLRR